MPRTYKPKPGAKTYRKHDNINIEKALEELKANNVPSIRSVAEKYGIPFSVLQRRNTKKVKRQGGQTALSLEAEIYIIENLNICADWGYPLDKTDLRYIVKMYLDTANICVKRFKNNFPGSDYAESFLKRHRDIISTRISQNIKRARAEVCPETIAKYFEELEKSLDGVPLSNIVNYDETNLTDDPGRPKVIVRRGCKYPERVRNHSKGCTSLMMAANAEGEILNPYVVYKSIHLYDSWTQNGPKGTRYNRSSSGWFDGPIFCDWVKSIAIPYLDKKTGKKILIGDNLSSHLSVDLIRMCIEKDIHFVFLPANSTHLTQPLDVAFFRTMKQTWRHILQKWKQNDGRCLSSIPKGCFPRLLKLLMDQLEHNAEKNIRSGFRKTGIAPLNCQEVISRLPNETNDTVDKDAVDESFLTLLKEMRYGTMNITEPKKKKKLEVMPGKSVDPDELNVEANEPKPANGGRKEKTIKNKGTGKQTKPKPSNSHGTQNLKIPEPSSNDQNFIPISLSTPIVLDCTTTVTPSSSENLGVDIQSLPVILAEDIFFSREETCEDIIESTTPTIDANKENEQQRTNINENAKKFKIKILSDEKITNKNYSNKRKSHQEYGDQTRKNAKITKHKNLYADADEILNILQE